VQIARPISRRPSASAVQKRPVKGSTNPLKKDVKLVLFSGEVVLQFVEFNPDRWLRAKLSVDQSRGWSAMGSGLRFAILLINVY
jgi:hypothetical protein